MMTARAVGDKMTGHDASQSSIRPLILCVLSTLGFVLGYGSIAS